MTGHPDADAVAACREGLLGRRRSARIRAHLARCSRCATLDGGLAEVTALLASVPAPRMPDELAARLDAVLAAESAARARAEAPAPATEAPAAAAAASGPARPGRRPRAWRVTALRAASVTAVLLVIAGGGYGVSRLLPAGGGTASSSASPGHPPPARPNIPAPAGGPGPQGNPPAAVTEVRSGTDYLPGRLAAQAEAVLARHPPARAPAPAAGRGGTMAGCRMPVSGGIPPTLVDLARYRGQPAMVIVRAPAGGRPGHVWVVRPRCPATSSGLIAQAALTASG